MNRSRFLPFPPLRAILAAALLAGVALVPVTRCALAAPTVVFSTDFESGVPPEFSAPGCGLYPVEGWAGLGPPGRQFGGVFLRYTSVPLFPTTLTLRNLPPHDHLSVRFLLAVIDSWDGTELFQVSVDDSMRFNHWFQLATGDTTDYYPAPPGAILSMGTNLGYSGCCYYNRDRAYDLGVEPAFLDIPHTADSVVVAWNIGAISGPAADQWQGGDDESWAIDDVSVEVSTQTTDVPGTVTPRAALALRAVPNPAGAGALRFLVTLPGAGAARLELFDLAGRRVDTRDLAGGAAGARWESLSPATRVRPGLYFARLVQDGAERTTRVLVVDAGAAAGSRAP